MTSDILLRIDVKRSKHAPGGLAVELPIMPDNPAVLLSALSAVVLSAQKTILDSAKSQKYADEELR